MTETLGITMIVFFILGVWLGIHVYKIGRKHGIIIGRAEIAKRVMAVENTAGKLPNLLDQEDEK